MATEYGKILILFTAATLFLGLASSDWYFEPNNKNIENLSNGSNSVFTTQLKTQSNDEILRPEDIVNFTTDEGAQGENTYVIFEYSFLNSTTGNPMRENQTLNYHSGLDTWYAEFSTDDISMQNLTLKASGEGEGGLEDSQGEVEENISVDVNEEKPELLDVNLQYDFTDPIKAEREFKADVQVMNTTDESILGENDVDVSVYFHNLTDTEEVFQLNNYNDEENYHFNAEVDTPTATDSNYIFRIEASNTSTDETIGSQSMIVETAPAINGEIENITSSGCSDQEVATECDPGAEIDTEFDVTAAGAQGVNMTVYKQNMSGSWINHSTTEMTEISTDEDGVLQTFEASENIPDLNTSEFDKQVKINYHAFNQDRDYEENHTVDLRSFVIEDRSNPTAFKTREHEIQLFLGERFSRDSFNKSRFQELNVNLTGPEEYNTSYTMEDFEYRESDGTFENTVVIPESAEIGAYELEITVNNTYGESKEATRGLQVRDVNSTFSAESELDLEYDSLGEFSKNISLDNLVDSEKTLEVYNDNENISVQDEITLESGEQQDITFDINLSEPGSFDTDIEFVDSAARYNETTEINVQGPDCQIISGDLCVDTSDLEMSVSELSETVEEITVTNLGDEDLEITNSITGNASEAFSVEENVTVSDTETVEVNFSPESAGTFEGELEMETDEESASVNLKGDADFEEVETGLETSPSSIEIGTLPEGESHDTELTVENTGDVDVEGITASTGGLDLEIEEFSLEAGTMETFDLSISNPQNTTMTFTGESSQGELTVDVPVTVNIIENYADRTDELRDSLQELRPQTEDPELDQQLSEVSGMIERINSQWDSGDYADARSTFQEAQSMIQTVESQMNTDDSGGDENTDEDQNDENEGGGLPILPIVSILFVLLGIGGFVFYESYIPEEGDPLYGVLGEK